MSNLYSSKTYMVNIDLGNDEKDSEIDILAIENGRIKPYKTIKGVDAVNKYTSLLNLFANKY